MTSNDLHRTNINLRKDDVEYLRNLLGFGWTEKVREIVHEYVREMQKRDQIYPYEVFKQ
jgi:hypothetical protein